MRNDMETIPAHTPRLNIPAFFAGFNSPITLEDCGQLCAPHNPTGKPFCCDICQAVPVAYRQEWNFFPHKQTMARMARDECKCEPGYPQEMRAETRNTWCCGCQGPHSAGVNFGRQAAAIPFPLRHINLPVH
jgi:hypothetical protein